MVHRTAATPDVVEADSAGWIHIGSVVNGTPVAGNLNYAGVGVASGSTGRIDFVNAPPIYSTKFRTFRSDLIATDVDNKAKVGKLVLTHISARINDSALLLSQASRRFPRVEVGEDFGSYELALPE